MYNICKYAFHVNVIMNISRHDKNIYIFFIQNTLLLYFYLCKFTNQTSHLITYRTLLYYVRGLYGNFAYQRQKLEYLCTKSFPKNKMAFLNWAHLSLAHISCNTVDIAFCMWVCLSFSLTLTSEDGRFQFFALSITTLI